MTALDLLAKRGLDPELCERLGIRPWANPSGKLADERRAQHGRDDDWIEIDYLCPDGTTRKKMRPLREPKKGFIFMTPGHRISAWNRQVLEDTTLADQPLVITEGELDAAAAIQCGWPRTVSHPTGAPDTDYEAQDTARFDWLETERAHLRGVKEIILAADGDRAGIILRNQLAMRLGRARCKWLPYPKACKDLGDTLRLHGQAGIDAAMARAQWMPVAGVHRWDQLPPTEHRPSWDIPLIQDVWRPRPGDFTVITDIPGHGKSTFLNWVAVKLAQDHNIRTAIASFELEDDDARRTFRGMAAGQDVTGFTEYRLRELDAWLNSHLLMMVPPTDGEASLPWLWDCMEAAVLRHLCQMIIIDPWNQMDHLRRRDETLTEYTGNAIKQIKTFAKAFGCHVVVAAHPAKRQSGADPYPPDLNDISDSAHWYNKPDVGLTVWRDRNNLTTIFNRKARNDGIVGTWNAAVKLRWNRESMAFEGA